MTSIPSNIVALAGLCVFICLALGLITAVEVVISAVEAWRRANRRRQLMRMTSAEMTQRARENRL